MRRADKPRGPLTGMLSAPCGVWVRLEQGCSMRQGVYPCCDCQFGEQPHQPAAWRHVLAGATRRAMGFVAALGPRAGVRS